MAQLASRKDIAIDLGDCLQMRTHRDTTSRWVMQPVLQGAAQTECEPLVHIPSR